MTNHKSHSKEMEFNSNQIMMNSRLNAEAVLSETVDSYSGTTALIINAINHPVNFIANVISSGETGTFTVICDASGTVIQSGDEVRLEMLEFTTASTLFVHDLWNRLYLSLVPFNLGTTFVVLHGVGVHDIQTLRFEGAYVVDPFTHSEISDVLDNFTLPGYHSGACPHCGKLCILKLVMNRLLGYCSEHGRFHAIEEFKTREQELKYTSDKDILKSTFRGLRSHRQESIDSYEQWLSSTSPLKEAFIFERFDLATFFMKKGLSDDRPNDSPELLSKIKTKNKNKSATEINYDIMMTRKDIQMNEYGIKQCFEQLESGNYVLRDWNHIVWLLFRCNQL